MFHQFAFVVERPKAFSPCIFQLVLGWLQDYWFPSQGHLVATHLVVEGPQPSFFWFRASQRTKSSTWFWSMGARTEPSTVDFSEAWRDTLYVMESMLGVNVDHLLLIYEWNQEQGNTNEIVLPSLFKKFLLWRDLLKGEGLGWIISLNIHDTMK